MKTKWEGKHVSHSLSVGGTEAEIHQFNPTGFQGESSALKLKASWLKCVE